VKRFFLKFKPSEIVIAVIMGVFCGVLFGFFVNGYWLMDYFPAGSKRLLLATIFACLGGAIVYSALFLWLKMRFQPYSRQQTLALSGISLLFGTVFFFTATDHWQQPVRYITSLLPKHTLDVSISPASQDGEIQVLWFETSLGDISFRDLQYQGWQLDNDRLILVDYANNQLHWSGKTGENAQIVFYSPADNGNVTAAWDGQREVFPLLGQKYTYYHFFIIPRYAYRLWILLCGILSFSIFSLPLCLLVWEKRSELLAVLQSEPLSSQHPIGRQDVLVILLLMILAGVLRFPNLENLFPISDEYQQLIAAKQIIAGTPWQDVYQRSLWILTFPISIAFRAFGYEIWIARSVGVVFNTLAIIPLYMICRKINRPVVIFAGILYATNPLIIALARVAREYAYYPFYFYWIIYGMVVALEHIQAYVRRSDKRARLFTPQFVFLGLVLSLPVIYTVYVDIYSTMKIILIAYLITALFIILLIGEKIGQSAITIMVLVAAGMLLLLVQFVLPRFSLSLGFDPTPIYHFFPNPPQQWYFERLTIVPVVGTLLGIVGSWMTRRKNFVPLFFAVLCIVFLSFFVFSSRRFEARHFSTVVLWFIVLLAYGIRKLWSFLESFPLFQGKIIKSATLTILAIATINIPQILLPLSHEPVMNITGHYHPNLRQLNDYLLAHNREGDVIISSNAYLWYTEWMGQPKFSEEYYFSVTTTNGAIQSIVEQHASGWIVFDKIWVNQLAFPLFQALSQNHSIEFIGTFDDIYLWYWNNN